MKYKQEFLILFCVFLFQFSSAGYLQANWWCPSEVYCSKIQGHLPYIGSDIYYVHRSRENGSKQSGPVAGVRVGYDYIKRYRPYFGIEGVWAQGTLTGHSGEGKRTKATFTDMYAEGRVGYTLQQKAGWQAFFTPFVGGGYLEEKTNFVSPSPSRYHNKLKFPYVTAGFLSGLTLMPRLDLGLSFKLRYMWEPKNCVTHDPKFDDSEQLIKNEKLQYRVELPFIYKWNKRFLISLGPFYEYRHYGSHANFPSNFFETTLQMYGGTLRLIYNF